MGRLVLLDSGPLGIASQARGKPSADRFELWLSSLESAGTLIVIPEITDYEVRRELRRIGATASLHRLDGLQGRLIYQPITTAAMREAADFWARLRNAGLPTAGPQDLDADAILAGQAKTVGTSRDIILVATTNARHLARFPGIHALDWLTIS